MQTIVLATQKGGSGKSTLAIGLALAAMQDGHTVRLIETDPQRTLTNWKRRRADAEPSVEPVDLVGEFAPSGKSAEEIRGLWQWVSNRLGPVARADAHGVLYDATAPATVPTMFPVTEAEESASAPEDSGRGRG